MRCPICGKEAPQGAAVCPTCGRSLRPGNGQPQGGYRSNQGYNPQQRPGQRPMSNQQRPYGNQGGQQRPYGQPQPNQGYAQQGYGAQNQRGQQAYGAGRGYGAAPALPKSAQIMAYVSAGLCVLMAAFWFIPFYGDGFSFFDAMNAGAIPGWVSLILFLCGVLVPAVLTLIAAIRKMKKYKLFVSSLYIAAAVELYGMIILTVSFAQNSIGFGGYGVGTYLGYVLAVALIVTATFAVIAKKK